MSDAESNAARIEATCSQCGAPLRPGARFCAGCGVRQRTEPAAEVAPRRESTAADRACRSCGAPLAGEVGRFCRVCGQLLNPADLSVEPLPGSRRGPGQLEPGQCPGCGRPAVGERRFCQHCGSALRITRRSQSEVVAEDPGWFRVVKGLGYIWEGNVTLVASAVLAIAVITLLSLVGPDWARLPLVRAGLLGGAGLGAATGMLLVVRGELFCLSIPRSSGAWISAVVSAGFGALFTLAGLAALGLLASRGFAVARLPDPVLVLAALAAAFLILRLVAFSTMLRRVAFALRHYRIAHGSVGFIVFIGLGLAVVGLCHLLFQSARAAVQTFSELLAVAFVLLTMLWYLTMTRRGRDLVKQRLP